MTEAEKSLQCYFIDWEAYVFGYGYGTGEHHVIPLLKRFFNCLESGEDCKPYKYDELQEKLGHEQTWLLINVFCHADIIEYGTSPRFGWLTEKGKRLYKFIAEHSADDLINIVQSRDQEYYPCHPDYCNCHKDTPCVNPFWTKKI
jgi:hypothetical protein